MSNVRLQDIMLSLDLFLKAIDRFIQLASVRAESRRRLFKELVEPLFHELESVVDDYYAFFSKSLVLLQGADRESMTAVVAQVREMREQQMLTRVKLRQLAASLQEHSKDDMVVQFCRAVCGMFEAAPNRSTTRKMSKSAELLDLFELVASEKINRSGLASVIKDSKDEFALQWIAAVQSYGYLKLRSVQ
jgi:hypothetical protein